MKRLINRLINMFLFHLVLKSYWQKSNKLIPSCIAKGDVIEILLYTQREIVEVENIEVKFTG